MHNADTIVCEACMRIRSGQYSHLHYITCSTYSDSQFSVTAPCSGACAQQFLAMNVVVPDQPLMTVSARCIHALDTNSKLPSTL